MKIEICKDGKIKKDGVELKIVDINSELLEKIMDLGLSDELEFIDNSGDNLKGEPTVELFKSLYDSFKKDSDFRKEINELELQKKDIDNKITAVEEDNDTEKNNNKINDEK